MALHAKRNSVEEALKKPRAQEQQETTQIEHPQLCRENQSLQSYFLLKQSDVVLQLTNKLWEDLLKKIGSLKTKWIPSFFFPPGRAAQLAGHKFPTRD